MSHEAEATTVASVQIGLVGAVQRTDPIVAALFLRWTGVQDAELCPFNILGDGNVLMSVVEISPKARNVITTRDMLCKFAGVAAGEPEYRSSVLKLSETSPYHARFWSRVLSRDSKRVPSPLEFWWALACVRHGGPLRASLMLLSILGVKAEKRLAGCVIELVNPTLNTAARDVDKALVNGPYRQPRSLRCYTRVDGRGSATPIALSIPLADEAQRDRVASAMMTLALTVET